MLGFMTGESSGLPEEMAARLGIIKRRRDMFRRVGDDTAYSDPPLLPKKAPVVETGGDAPIIPLGALSVETPAPIVSSRDMELAPHVRVKGQAITKPTRPDTGDREADRALWLADNKSWKDPKDRDGRFWSALKEAGVNMAANSGNGLAAMLGAGIFGAARGAITPNIGERRWRDANIAAEEQEQRRDIALRRVQIDDATKLAQLEKIQRENNEIGKLKPREPKLFQGADGLQYEYDPETRSARALPGQSGKPSASKVLRTVTRGNKVWYETEEGLRPALDPATGKQLEEPLREVTLGGQKFSLPESQAAQILGTVEAANITATGRHSDQTYEDQVREQQEGFKRADSRWEDADRKVKELREAIADAQKAAARANNPPPSGQYAADENDKRRYWEEWESAMKRVRMLGQSIRTAYGDVVEDDPETKFPTLMRARPQAPAPLSRPAPPRRTATVAPRSAVSEDAFLAAARQRLGRNFNEQEARAAYRRRYAAQNR